MTNSCSTCNHPQRLQIDRELVQGGALSRLARKYNVSDYSLGYHRDNHLSRQLVQSWRQKELMEGTDLLTRIDQIIQRAEDIFTRNYKARKDGVALKALDSQRSTIELLAKISYSLHQAKIAELEAAREASGANEQEEEMYYQEQLTVLTTNELNLFQQLIEKIQSQDKKMIVLPDTNEFPHVVPPYRDNKASEPIIRRKPVTTPPNRVELKRTKAPANVVPDDNLTVRPIPPVRIPSEDASHNLLSPARRRST